MNADPAAGLTALGIIAGLQRDYVKMHDFHLRAIRYARTPNTLYNYAVSLMLAGFLAEAMDYAKQAFELSPPAEIRNQCLSLLIESCDRLGLEEEFIDFAYEWEVITGKPHPLMDHDPSEDEEELDLSLSALEHKVSEDRKSFVKMDEFELG
jgi:hypothetical protein